MALEACTRRAGSRCAEEGEDPVGDPIWPFVRQAVRRPLDGLHREVVRGRLTASVHLPHHGGIRGALEHAGGNGQPALPVRPRSDAAHLAQDQQAVKRRPGPRALGLPERGEERLAWWRVGGPWLCAGGCYDGW